MISRYSWTAFNNSSFLNGSREAKTLRSAVLAARKYVDSELMGEGTIVYYENSLHVRTDKKTIFTSMQWEKTEH